MTVLRGTDLVELGYRTLADALAGVLGFRDNEDRAYAGLGVRGLYVLGDQNTRVLILLDGHALNSAAEVGSSKIGEDFGIPMDQVERIEVIRGPASSLYGNNAFLGMVNVVTKAPPERPLGGLAEITRSSQSLSGLDGTVGGTSGTTRWQATVSGMQRRGSITQFPEWMPGPLPGNLDREERQSAYLKISGREWNLAGYVSDRTQWLSSAPFDSAPFSMDNKYVNRLSFFDGGWTPRFGAVDTLVRAYGDRNQFFNTLDFDGIRLPGSEGAYSDSEPNWSLGLELQARTPLGSRVFLTLGQEQSWQHYSGDVDLASTVVTTQVQHRVSNTYLQAEWTPAETFSATFGFQESAWIVDSASSDIAGAPASYAPAALRGGTPRLALIWSPTSVDIFKALYGGGYRNPTNFERYYQDAGTFVPNPSPARAHRHAPGHVGAGVGLGPAEPALRIALALDAPGGGDRPRRRHAAVPERPRRPDRLGPGGGAPGPLGRLGPLRLGRTVPGWSEAGQPFPDSTGAQAGFRLTAALGRLERQR